ncbi:MAG: pitrilysin family protein [Hyphomicrobiaceae bacterium]
MTVEVSTLANGMRIVTHAMPHLETVSLGIWVGCGARSECRTLNGISHLLEHMAFKGTERRNARQIVEEIEAVGGDINAATSLESTAYYARVLKDDVALAIDILGDILQHSQFHGSELTRERDVILQEIAAANDCPDDVAFDAVQETAFPDQALGRPILGTTETVGRVTRANLIEHMSRNYLGGDMVLSAAGKLQHDQVVRHAEAQFGRLNSGNGPPLEVARYAGGPCVRTKPFEQTHAILAFLGPSYRDDAFYAAQVFSGLLGGGLSSRLFQEVRERRGLCYSIYSFCNAMSDVGLFGVHAGTTDELVPELRDVVIAELSEIAAQGPGDDELQRSKAQLKAGLAMSLESTGARAEQMARQLLAFGRPLGVDELVGRVEAVSCADVQSTAERIVTGSRPTWSHVGPGVPNADYDHLTARLAGG